MKIYRMKRLKFNPCPIIGTVLLILCFVPYIFIPGLMPENHIEDDTFGLRVALILLSGICFFASLTAFALTRSFNTGERQEAFAETEDGKLLYLFVVPEAPVMARSTIGKLASIPKNIEIDERNVELISLMDRPELAEFLEEYFRGNDEAVNGSDFAGKICCHIMDNPRLVEKVFNGYKIFYTVGKHQKIFSAVISRRSEGFRRVCDIISSTPCRLDYTGKNAGDCFVE